MRLLLIPLFVAGLLAEVLSEGEWCGKNDTFKHPAVGTCIGYWECDHGNVTYRRCSSLYSFDSSKQECVWNPMGSDDVPCGTENGPIANDNWCTIGRTYKAPVVGLCDSYYDCRSGVLELKACTWPMKFNPNERECGVDVWPFEFSCLSDSVTPPQPEKPSCSKGQSFVRVYSTDCSKFFSCDDGRLSTKSCGYFQKFDPTQLECRYNFPWNSVNCNAPSNPTTTQATTTSTAATTISTTVTTTTVTTTKPVTKTTSVTTTTTPSPFKNIGCLKGNYFTVPQPDDCQKYLVCSNGVVTAEECSYLFVFNPLTHSCEYGGWFSSVNCSAKTDKPFCTTGYEYKTSYPGDSSKYYSCSNGTLSVENCGMFKSYKESTQQCRTYIFGYTLDLAQNNGFKCVKDGFYNSTFPDDCHKYYNCKNGTLKTMECPYAHKFDMKSGKCVLMTNCDLLTCISKGPICYKGYDYVTSVPEDCTKYSECKDGCWIIKSCSWLHKFDPKTLKCTLSIFSSVDCKAKTKCNPKTLFSEAYSYKQMKNIKFQNEVTNFMSNMQLGVPTCNAGARFKAVDPKDCYSYYQCNNGNMTIKQCSTFDKFDPKILDCRFDTPWNPVDCKSLPGQPSCTAGHDFNSVMPDHCNRYYHCNNGSLKVENCYFWQKFDPATLECRLNVPWIYNVNCSAKPGSGINHDKVKPATESNAKVVVTTPTPAPVKGPSCSVGQNFRSVYGDDCQKYFDCSNGTETVEKCFWFRKFNPAKLDCNWDLPFFRVNCSAVPGSGLPKPIVYPSNVKSRCQQGISFNAVDRKNCDSYYKCSNGVLSLDECGWWKKFNPQTLKCAFDLPFSRVNCTALPGEPQCPANGITRIPYPGDCSKHYECRAGSLSIVNCGLFQKFDHKTLKCSYDIPFDPVNCGDDGN